MSLQLQYDERAENPRYELIDGVERLQAQPNTNHSRIARNLSHIIYRYLRGKKCELFGEVDVFFDENNRFVPDLVVVCDKSKVKLNGIYGAPDLVIEILSPSTAKNDRREKKMVYEKSGVREYWIVEPASKNVEVYHLKNNELCLVDVCHDYTEEEWDMLNEKEKAKQTLKIKVSLYDDLEVDVKEIFEV